MGTLERRMATGVRSDNQPDLRADTRRNRDRILPTGVQCISLARPSRKIAKIAGIRGGTLYRRFQSREALLAAALQGKQVELLARSEKGRAWGSQPPIRQREIP
jgi:AcrR family transcriptional regulator